jgi:iron(III) transport system substrate-binding protein
LSEISNPLRTRPVLWASALVATLLAACATTPSAQVPPASPPSGERTAPAQPSPPDAAWAQTVAAAKREGKLVILAPPGTEIRDALTVGFRQRYPEIQVDYSSLTASQVPPKLFAERQAGQYLADIYMGGTRGAVLDLLPAGALDPLPAFLVGPDITDSAAWLGDKLEFADDEGQYTLVFTSALNSPLAHHSQLVAQGDIKSYRDLVDPKWRGRIAMQDPRTGGAGLGLSTFIYTSPSLGKDFLQTLLTSGLVFTSDGTQLVDWVARGQYPVAISPNEFHVVEAKRKGLPIEPISATSMQEGGYITSAVGNVAVINNAPHPNAVKLYLNWLLSRDGQTEYSRETLYPSRRKDVPTDHLLETSLPRPGPHYRENYTAPFLRVQAEVQDFVRSVIPR